MGGTITILYNNLWEAPLHGSARSQSTIYILYKQYQLNFLSLYLLSSRPFHRSQNSIVINSVYMCYSFFLIVVQCTWVALGFSIVWQRLLLLPSLLTSCPSSLPLWWLLLLLLLFMLLLFLFVSFVCYFIVVVVVIAVAVDVLYISASESEA